MTREALIEKLNKILKSMESIDIMHWERRSINQVKLNQAYNMVEELKKDIGGN